MPRLCLIGSSDTKGRLLDRLAQKARARGVRPVMVDSKLSGMSHLGKDKAMRLAAGRVEKAMAKMGDNCAFLAIGGGTGSWVALKAMSALPLGAPKVMVSTLAFDPRPMVAGTDIVIIPSPVDLVGDNCFVEAALDAGVNVALGLQRPPALAKSKQPMVAVTALGVVQRCVDTVVDALEKSGHRTCVFHAAGENGKTLARWIGTNMVEAVVDLAPNDLHPLFGNCEGNTQGMDRLSVAIKAKKPYLFVPGGLDFLSRPTGGLTPAERKKASYVHSPAFTHVRTTRSQVARAARFVATKLGRKKSIARIVIPDKGWSYANRAGGPLAAPKIDDAFAARLLAAGMPEEKVIALPRHINDAVFAKSVARAMVAMLKERSVVM